MGCSFTPSSSECELCHSSFTLDSSMHHRGGSSGSSDLSVSWVKPGDLKLLYRIGRGQFGDVWLANLCSSSEHQVAVKMLPVIGKDVIDAVLRRFDTLLFPSQGLKGVNAPLGVSLKNGKICILSTLYEGSVGGRMAHLPGNRLCLSDVLRFSADIARGVIELHCHGIVSLGLKPCNFLLNSQDEAVVGDYGIPLLFSGCTFLGFKFWLGTPNYMAPEQWNVGTRGPITYETDSWGFGCCIVEMVTGRKPWEGKSPREIYSLVVLNGEKPHIPSGLPVAVQRVLEACFEYDYRNRPDFYDILSALTSPNIVVKRGDWVALRDESAKRIGIVKSTGEADPSSVLVQFSKKESQALWQDSRGLTLLKDPLQVGDHVRVRQSARLSTPHEAEGVVVEIDTDEILVRVRFCGCQDIWEGSSDDLELVSLGIVAGDWVHRSAGELDGQEQQEEQASCVGVVHTVQHNGEVQAAFAGYETLWTGAPSRLARMSPFQVGQTVKLSRRCKTSPRFEWLGKQTAGRIERIMPNGCLVLGHLGRPWRREKWWCDPAQVELVHGSTTGTNLASLIVMSHWYVTPMVIALGLLAGALVGNAILRSNSPAAGAGAAGVAESLCSSSEEFTIQETEDDSSNSSSSSRSWIVQAFNVVAAHLADGNDALLH